MPNHHESRQSQSPAALSILHGNLQKLGTRNTQTTQCQHHLAAPHKFNVEFRNNKSTKILVGHSMSLDLTPVPKFEPQWLTIEAQWLSAEPHRRRIIALMFSKVDLLLSKVVSSTNLSNSRHTDHIRDIDIRMS